MKVDAINKDAPVTIRLPGLHLWQNTLRLNQRITVRVKCDL